MKVVLDPWEKALLSQQRLVLLKSESINTVLDPSLGVAPPLSSLPWTTRTEMASVVANAEGCI